MISVCSLSAKEDTTDPRQGISFPGLGILTIAIKQLWKILLLPKLALTLQFMVGSPCEPVKQILCSKAEERRGLALLSFLVGFPSTCVFPEEL